MMRPPDVEIRTAVRARELRFECKPQVTVRRSGTSPADAASQSWRDNLPGELEEGVTYRNVGIRWHAWARLHDPPEQH